MMWMPRHFQKVTVPEGVSGDWQVEHFTVSAKDLEFTNLRIMLTPGMGHRVIDPGTYTRLTRRSAIVMTDTSAEMIEHTNPVRMADGDVLLNGLGLGVVLTALLNKKSGHITVIERSQNVLDLISPHYTDSRVTFIHADALEWRPEKGTRYSVVWHDIWDDICGDNLKDMHRLHRAYGKRCDWQGSWSREYL